MLLGMSQVMIKKDKNMIILEDFLDNLKVKILDKVEMVLILLEVLDLIINLVKILFIKQEEDKTLLEQVLHSKMQILIRFCNSQKKMELNQKTYKITLNLVSLTKCLVQMKNQKIQKTKSSTKLNKKQLNLCLKKCKKSQKKKSSFTRSKRKSINSKPMDLNHRILLQEIIISNNRTIKVHTNKVKAKIILNSTLLRDSINNNLHHRINRIIKIKIKTNMNLTLSKDSSPIKMFITINQNNKIINKIMLTILQMQLFKINIFLFFLKFCRLVLFKFFFIQKYKESQ
ncbi:transmembrane protein, putative (macronuclear) [Tetrahymena thermophila SB210]|uniref:Transmembrane protein, putative n=1 Tax=Tetrahymena thermophila (strain SB210) TaxID=312017 RepID=W7X8F9_TETTS|nr:transmembrane protein, putative [Tetrahymena thermophila SB210]EWS72693.1 transmembrane protein, putative [Tetrahymena thermophila SB210]|eukprot:XP_012654769.1 transmembrane protein, putative [Tetrahymena thermophila SB210]